MTFKVNDGKENQEEEEDEGESNSSTTTTNTQLISTPPKRTPHRNNLEVVETKQVQKKSNKPLCFKNDAAIQGKAKESKAQAITGVH